MLTALNKEPRSEAKKWCVLLVDDEEFNHEILDLSLNKAVFSLIGAKNVTEALRILDTTDPDIVITDAMMPGESGFSLIEKLRANPKTKDIPVILWTILENPDGTVMDSSKRADFSVSKPFYHSEILDVLDKATELAKERAAKART
jgi:CheY-like chemotaxis protein